MRASALPLGVGESVTPVATAAREGVSISSAACPQVRITYDSSLACACAATARSASSFRRVADLSSVGAA